MNAMLSLRARAGTAYRALRSTVAGSALVLTYHRVTTLDRDPQLLCVGPREFDEQMACIAEEYRPVSARGLLEMLAAKRRIPRRTVVVTFDDGYADLLSEALPVLERRGVPGTAFVNTAQIGTDRERWWDELEYLCLGTGASPESLQLEIPGAPAFAFTSRRDPVSREHESTEATLWNITTRPRDARERLYTALCEHMRPLPPGTQDTTLDALAATLGVQRPERPTRRTLDAKELLALDASGAMEIGAHTASHRFLAAASPAEQASEITRGKTELEALLGRKVDLFSYPFGGRDAIDASAMQAVRDAGLGCGFANWFGLVFPWNDPFALPRCPTSNTGREEFSAQLRTWFSMGR